MLWCWPPSSEGFGEESCPLIPPAVQATDLHQHGRAGETRSHMDSHEDSFGHIGNSENGLLL